MVNVGGSHFKATLKMLYLYGYKGFVPVVAEEVGFEPTVGINLRRFSRPVHSTTLPLLRQRPVRHFGPIRKAASQFGNIRR